MCLVKTPKLKSDTDASQPKEPTIIRNPYLDGVGPTARAARKGRSSLRIKRGTQNAGGGSPSIPPSAPPIATTPPGSPVPPRTPPGVSPVPGGGGYRSIRLTPHVY